MSRLHLVAAALIAGLVAMAATPTLAADDVFPPSVPKSVRAGKYPPEMPETEVETYRKVGDTEMKLYVFQPDRPKTLAKGLESRPAIVFFFGGGWRAGNPGQFYPHCRYLAREGMVAITADYRVSSRNESTPQDAVEDAKAAIRYVRENARRLGVDPDKIVASGGSAGGHLAACTGVVPGFEPKDVETSSVPNAMVLFNPAVMLAPLDGENPLGEEKANDIAERTGGKPVEISPIHHVRKNLPPTLILHGTKDTAVPFASVELFAKRMRAEGNECEVAAYEGRPHGFFNYSRSEEDYVDTLEKVDAFLVEHGFLVPAAKR